MDKITKEQFIEQVKPYVAKQKKKAYMDGYDLGYLDGKHELPHRYNRGEAPLKDTP